ncbi:hypothetical protein RRF57_004255 [Xylaria bambusicola]|uniref:Uncharacterized protein n=1 Tax=Xylaria bambusicola TaxID=326684 RepID=A0AAN7UAB4_9PEZI
MVVDELWGLVGLGLELSGGGDRKQEINNERRGDDGMEKAAEYEGTKRNLLLGTDWGKASRVYIKRIVGEIGLE